MDAIDDAAWQCQLALIKRVMLSTIDELARRDSIELILSNGLTLGVLVAIFLHLVLPYHEDDDSLTVVIDGDVKPAKGIDASASDAESVDEKVCTESLPLCARLLLLFVAHVVDLFLPCCHCFFSKASALSI